MPWSSRGSATLVQALGTLVVAAGVGLLIFHLWYPWPFATLAGGNRLFALVVCVDLAIGPFATFCVFDRAKGWPVLRRDLAVLLVLRLAALGFGIHVAFGARPAVLALEGERFRVIAAVDIVTDELPLAPDALRELPLDGPRIIATTPPTDPQELFASVQLALAGIDLGQRPRYWRPWDDAARSAAAALCRPPGRLQGLDVAQRAAVERAMSGSARPCYLPLLARDGEWIVLLDASDGRITGFANATGD